ncbi:dTDP-glucose 4,6-dehydratase [Paenibacillus chartarius]|uniref:dTDP-glucose 4,6-dehydratase n=1 Tax=Paenibacillus chartarius TaxID=747481 RepID=A0ABV6DIG4_9BACL
MKLLVTGGMGFIGSNFVRYWLDKHPEDEVVNLDKLTYAGNPANVEDLRDRPQHRFIQGDAAARRWIDRLFETEQFDYVVHFAAESHVDRSIRDPGRFVKTNVAGTQHLLQASLNHRIKRYVQISTDEVYGSLGPEGLFSETTPLAPNSPYSASKASADLLARAYFETFGLPVLITRCSNNYGPYQFPEKLIPTIITRALRNEDIPIYGDGRNIRDWLYVEDHCSAIELVLLKGEPGQVYNIGGRNEHTNLDIARRILRELGKPDSLIKFVPDRLGHDRRYAIDAAKIENELGWRAVENFDTGLKKTLQWYVKHTDWWQDILSGRYRQLLP